MSAIVPGDIAETSTTPIDRMQRREYSGHFWSSRGDLSQQGRFTGVRVTD